MLFCFGLRIMEAMAEDLPIVKNPSINEFQNRSDGNTYDFNAPPGGMFRTITMAEGFEEELGFQYELPGGGHYQEVCPQCRRALFGLAQGALWQQYLNTPDGRKVG